MTIELDHDHCPYDCEHPQPFRQGDKSFCGRCWFVCGILTPMVQCTPETCAIGVPIVSSTQSDRHDD
jgi:hypothetical protein